MSEEGRCGEASFELTEDDRARQYLESRVRQEEVNKKKKNVPLKKKRNVVRLARSLIRLLAKAPTVISLEYSKLIVHDYEKFEALIPSYFVANRLSSVERQLNQYGFSKRYYSSRHVEYVKTRGIRINSVDDLHRIEFLSPRTRLTRTSNDPSLTLLQPYPCPIPPSPSEISSQEEDSYFLPLPLCSIELEPHRARMLELFYLRDTDESLTEPSFASRFVASWKKRNSPIKEVRVPAKTQEESATMTPRKKNTRSEEEGDDEEEEDKKNQCSASKMSPWGKMYHDMTHQQGLIAEEREDKYNFSAIQLLFSPTQSLSGNPGEEDEEKKAWYVEAPPPSSLFCYDPSRDEEDVRGAEE